MGIIADNLKKQKGESQEKIESLLDLAREEGVPVEEPKPKVSLLNKIFGALRTFETAPLAQSLLRGEGFGEALKKQTKVSGERISGKGLTDAPTYEDILEQEFGVKEDSAAARIGGLAGDIFLDPTTYFGGFLAKGGKKVAGKVAKGVGKTGKIGKALRKAPVVGKVVAGADEAAALARKAFDPLAGLEKGGFKEGAKVKEAFDVSLKKGRFLEGEAEEGLRKLITPEVAKTEDAGRLVGEALESGSLEALPEQLKPVGEYLQKGFKDMFGEEASAGLIKSNIDNYMAHVLTPEARKFFKGVDGGFDPTKLGFKKGRKLEGSAVEVNKSYRELLEKAGVEPFDLFEEDALKAFTVRKKSSLRALTHKGIVTDAEKVFGDTAEGLLGKGGSKFGNKIIQDGVHYVKTPSDALKFFGDDLEKLNKLGGDLAEGVGERYVPEAIAEELKAMNKLFINDKATNELAQNYDKALNFWKKSVTGFFPAFHGRNMMGGMFNNFLAGVKNPARYAQAEKLARGADEAIMIGGKQLDIAGRKQTYKSLLELMSQRGIVGGQGFLDIAATVDKTTDVAKAGKTGKVGRLVSKGPENVMNAIETRLRGTLLLDSLHKGDTFADATKKVFKFHFDYAPEAFTPFERNVMRRIVPFYTWTRKNIPLQFEQLIAQPGKFSALGKVGRTAKGDIDVEALPDYMKEGFVIKAGEKDGVPRILYNLGLPVGDINKLNKADITSLMSPFIKVPLELITNKNFFFDRPLDQSNRPPKGFAKAPKIIKNAVGYNEKTKVADPVRWHLLTAMAGRFLFTGTRLAEGDKTAGVTSLEQLFGIKSKKLEGSFDIEQQREYRQKDLLKELQGELRDKGVLYETSIFGKAKVR